MRTARTYFFFLTYRKVPFFALLLLLFASCDRHELIYPEKLTQAIDLFFIENKNDSVLILLNAPEIQAEIDGNAELFQLKTIFSAGAVCEKGNPDSAEMILNVIKPDKNNAKLLYYYNTISSLIDFRAYKHQKAYRNLLELVKKQNSEDIRALALNQRLLGRVLYHYTDLNNALQWFLLSRRHFEEAQLQKSAGINDKFISQVCVDLNLYESALTYLTSAEEIFLKYKDYDELFYAYLVHAELVNAQGMKREMMEYTLKAMNTHDYTDDKQMVAYIHLYLGYSAQIEKNYAKAVGQYEKVLSLGLNYYNSMALRRLAYLALAEVHNAKGEYVKSREYSQTALNTVLGNRNDNLRHKIYQQLAVSYKDENPNLQKQYMDSSIYFLNSYHKNRSEGLLKQFEIQQELHEAEHRADEAALKSKRQLMVTSLTTLFLLLTVIVLGRISQINRTKNRVLRELVRKNLLLFEEQKKQQQLPKTPVQSIKRKDVNPTEDERSKAIFAELTAWLESGENYKRKDLSLDVISKELGTNREYLSRAISSSDARFHELINNYRVEEAIKILSDPDDKRNKYNMKIISSDIGFNSHSVFVDAFKKYTGVTPAQFREHAKPNANES